MLISIIIPCKDEKENIDDLLADIYSQKLSCEIEVIKITNVYPAGKARNMGAKEAKGDIFIFFDCDIRLGNDYTIDNLVRPLIEDKNIGIVCSSIRIPSNASSFQVRYAQEIPHTQSPIVNKLTDVYVATSACCSISKDLFLKLSGFDEDIVRGEDSVFSFRIRRSGCRTVLAPNTWCYHPQPNNTSELIKTQFRNGAGAAFVDVFYPGLNIDVDPRGIVYPVKIQTKLFRIKRFILQFLTSIFTVRILLTLSKISYIIGYLYGFIKR